jgi:hypothetical protein
MSALASVCPWVLMTLFHRILEETMLAVPAELKRVIN